MKRYLWPIVTGIIIIVAVFSFSLKASPKTSANFTSYEVIYAKTPDKLRQSVNSEMQAGWQPIGGIAIEPGSFVQAMVR